MSEEKYSRALRLEFPGFRAGARAQARHAELDGRDGSTRACTDAAPRSIGERLRAGRERAGLSVAAAAEKLHLDPKVIEALEADRFAELGASVYVRGHLRRYARFRRRARRASWSSSYTAREARPPPPDLTQVPHRRAPRGSAPAGDAAGRPRLRCRAAARHLVGSRGLAVRRQRASTRRRRPVLGTRGRAGARFRRRRRRDRRRHPRRCRPQACAGASRRARPTTADAAAKRDDSRAGARDAPQARAHQRQLGRSLRFARRAPVLRRGERGQRAERERPRPLARGARQCRRCRPSKSTGRRARFPPAPSTGKARVSS